MTAEAAPAADGTRILARPRPRRHGQGLRPRPPRSSRATARPVDAWTLDQSAPWLSPNGDGVSDGFVVATRFSETAATSFTVKNAAGTTVKTLSSTGETRPLRLEPRNGADGSLVADGTYTWSFRAADTWGNGPLDPDRHVHRGRHRTRVHGRARGDGRRRTAGSSRRRR